LARIETLLEALDSGTRGRVPVAGGEFLFRVGVVEIGDRRRERLEFALWGWLALPRELVFDRLDCPFADQWRRANRVGLFNELEASG
jgi:hypothetical protein